MARSSFYYQPKGESDLNLKLMRLIDQEYTKHPFLGYRKMVYFLREHDYFLNKKRVARLMHTMGLQAMVAGPTTSHPAVGNPVYPYLLGGITIAHVNQVWSCDITYVPLEKGFVYLFAVMDWYSRYVLAWELSPSLEVGFCLEGLQRALGLGKPAIFNSDQGSQFTSLAFTAVLKAACIAISMDGRGRYLDNIFVERLWRTVKQEEVYLKNYTSPKEVSLGLGDYFQYYNHKRHHQALGYRTPWSVYQGE